MNLKALKIRIGWLEVALAASVILLVLQLWPSLARTLLYAIDFRHWPRTAWFFGNAVLVALLCGVRFGPDLVAGWQERRDRRGEELAKRAEALAKKEHREEIARIRESRKRRRF